jgi:hypothetical protein
LLLTGPRKIYIKLPILRRQLSRKLEISSATFGGKEIMAIESEAVNYGFE